MYRIEGTEDTANPYLLCAHLDVVPEGNAEDWAHDPFAAGIVNDVIYGRGAIDCKVGVKMTKNIRLIDQND